MVLHEGKTIKRIRLNRTVLGFARTPPKLSDDLEFDDARILEWKAPPLQRPLDGRR